MPNRIKKWSLGRTNNTQFIPLINFLLIAGCVVCGFSLSTGASSIGSASSQRRAHPQSRTTFYGHRQQGHNVPRTRSALSAKKNNKGDELYLAFVGNTLRNTVLKTMGFKDADAVEEDDAWKEQIINTKNIRGKNITKEAVSETWNRILSGEDTDGDATDHIWRDVLGDWSAVRQNALLLAGVRAVCVAVLTWGFCEAVLTSVSISGIRMWTALRQKSFVMRWDSFLRIIPEHRTVILNTYGILKVRFEALLFALKALGTLMVVPYYETLLCTIERVCFSTEYRKRYPLVSGLQGLIILVLVGWLFARIIAGVGVIACTVLGLGRLWIATKLGLI